MPVQLLEYICENAFEIISSNFEKTMSNCVATVPDDGIEQRYRSQDICKQCDDQVQGL